MNLDRREMHVLRELTQLGVRTRTLSGRLQSKSGGVCYDAREQVVSCSIFDPNSYDGFYEGKAAMSPLENKFSFPIGRMIAFARAVLEWYNCNKPTESPSFRISSKSLEGIARGLYTTHPAKYLSTPYPYPYTTEENYGFDELNPNLPYDILDEEEPDKEELDDRMCGVDCA